MLVYAIVVLGSYLLGSVSFAYVFGRVKGKDLSQLGSGNLGARNVSRILGITAGVIVGLLDFGKGFTAVYLARRFVGTDAAGLIALFGVVTGHCYSVFLRFRGGKGLAAGAGGLLLVNWQVLLLCALVGAAVLLVTRKVYTAAVVLTLHLPFGILIAFQSVTLFFLALGTACVVLSRHARDFPGVRERLYAYWGGACDTGEN
ncbi:MAG: glycerol-3-phosphate acyltransferase [Bacillota bacterium]